MCVCVVKSIMMTNEHVGHYFWLYLVHIIGTRYKSILFLVIFTAQWFELNSANAAAKDKKNIFLFEIIVNQS